MIRVNNIKMIHTTGIVLLIVIHSFNLCIFPSSKTNTSEISSSYEQNAFIYITSNFTSQSVSHIPALFFKKSSFFIFILLVIQRFPCPRNIKEKTIENI